jgi:hypothetical protein
MALYSGAHFDITGAGKPEAIGAGTVTSDFFSALGVEPLHGRVFRAEENNPGQNHEVILSYKFWQTHYAADPGAVGKAITLDGDPYTVVGVMGPAIVGVDYHPSVQQVAFLDTETGETGERRLNHSDGEAERFYRDLQRRQVKVRVGIEATGHARWFERLLAELKFEL